jgi:hypothetical protein
MKMNNNQIPSPNTHSADEISRILRKLHNSISGKIPKDVFLETAQNAGLNPSTAWNKYCQLYSASQRKVMNLAETTKFKSKASQKRLRAIDSSSDS